MKNLALLGGKPVRNKPYPLHSTMFGKEEEGALLEVLKNEHLSGFSARPGERFLGGNSVRRIEASISGLFNSHGAVTFNSATSGLHAALYAAGVSLGDEVITSPFTMSATASSILMCRATPIFCDIEDQTYGINPKEVEGLINEKTKAILAVNIFGHGASLVELRNLADKYNLLLIEDSAQAPLIKFDGKLCGQFGDIGVFSLNYHKAIQTGEGGFAISNNKELIKRMSYIRNHGEVVIGPAGKLDMLDIIGYNYRMPEIEAAIANEQLKKLEKLNQIRSRLSKYLMSELLEFNFLEGPMIKEGCEHGFYLLPIKYKQKKTGLSREVFTKALQAEGISISSGYVLPVHLQPYYQAHSQEKYLDYDGFQIEGLKEVDIDIWKKNNFLNINADYRRGICPKAEKMHFEEILTTDICKYPNSEKEIDEMVMALRKIVKNLDQLKKSSD